MRGIVVPLAALLALFAPAAAHAQFGFLPRIPLSLEVRGGGAFPTGDFTDADPGVGAESGPEFAAQAAIHVTSSLAVFGGYSRSHFGCPPCGARGIEDEVVDAGWDFGVQAALPLRALGAAPWLRVGGIYHELTFSGLGAELSSEESLGFRVGAGVAVPVAGSLRLTPGVFYSAYSADLDLGGLPGQEVDVTHLTASVGLAYRF